MPQDLIGKRPWILADAELASVGQVFAPAPGRAASGGAQHLPPVFQSQPGLCASPRQGSIGRVPALASGFPKSAGSSRQPPVRQYRAGPSTRLRFSEVSRVFAPAPGSAAKKSCAGRWSPDLALLRCLSLVFIPEG
jgi:hypothetical protein